MPMIEQRVRLSRRMKYRGISLVKMSVDQAKHLMPLGWNVVHQTHSYAYLQPPETYHGREIVLSLDVPDLEDIQALASRLHGARQAWTGRLNGWPARYQPRQEDTQRVRIVAYGEPARIEDQTYSYPAHFEIGDSVWSVGAIWEKGDDQEPRWYGIEDIPA